jgi:amidase
LPSSDAVFRRVAVLDDACAQADAVFHEPIERVVAALERALLSGPAAHVQAASGSDLDAWRTTYVTASAYDAWQVHGAWISEARPVFGDAVAGRWKMAAAVTEEVASTAFARQAQIIAQMSTLLGDDGVAVLPSASSVALTRNAASGDIDTVRNNTFRITCIAGLSGLPQVSLPFLTSEGLPIGVSLMGPAGSDAALVRLAVLIGTALGCVGTGEASAVGPSVAK